ncbi:hypothetical protein [Rhizobium leguminosarum]|uniref:hypothetical protein n=1 Tax=Rhizobium leguminosarum TaxID=384 RepID=UPI001C901833|nr:hypothetical protein [Rhizobium leguminosarum]MBY2985689.1 hypothetical protein [Rhizobium leguminosarum]
MSNGLLEAFSFVTVPFAAAGSVYAALKLLSRSEPLQLATLDWLTNRDPAATIHRMYILLRRFLYGGSILSWKRNASFAAVFLFFLSLLALGATYIEVGQEAGFLGSAIAMYAVWYFHMWSVAPAECLVLLLLGFLICHVSFYIFDVITLRWWGFGNSFWKYFLLLLAGYAICILLLLPLGFASAAFIGMRKDESILQALGRAIAGAPKMWHSLFFSESDHDLGDAIVFGIKVGIFGTMALCLSAVLVITTINLAYASGLGMLKIDYWLRVKYGYSQDAILKDPVTYLAVVVAVVIFIVVLMGKLTIRVGSVLGA